MSVQTICSHEHLSYPSMLLLEDQKQSRPRSAPVFPFLIVLHFHVGCHAASSLLNRAGYQHRFQQCDFVVRCCRPWRLFYLTLLVPIHTCQLLRPFFVAEAPFLNYQICLNRYVRLNVTQLLFLAPGMPTSPSSVSSIYRTNLANLPYFWSPGMMSTDLWNSTS